jgi:hypothetical protein
LVGISEGKRLLGRPKSRWEIILQWVLGKWGGEVVDWMHMNYDREQWGGGRFYCEIFYGYLHEFQMTHDIFLTLFCVTKKNLDSQCPGQYLN